VPPRAIPISELCYLLNGNLIGRRHVAVADAFIWQLTPNDAYGD
jgi:hypothetical protein